MSGDHGNNMEANLTTIYQDHDDWFAPLHQLKLLEVGLYLIQLKLLT